MAAVPNPRPLLRPWRDVARQLVNERNTRKISELCAELDQALAEQGMGDPNDEKHGHEKDAHPQKG